jgi:hypothetical protein
MIFEPDYNSYRLLTPVAEHASALDSGTLINWLSR